VADLGSRNGTFLDGVHIKQAFAHHDSTLRLGDTTLRLRFGDDRGQVALAERTQFGPLAGLSAAARATFALLRCPPRSLILACPWRRPGTGWFATSNANTLRSCSGAIKARPWKPRAPPVWTVDTSTG